jgi:2-methylaconitate cis-trans-isomerase PrpF
MKRMQAIPCTIMRGGTSKAVFLMVDDLPKDPMERDRVILKVFGSPDKRQIDGLGGADPLTSKVALIGAPTRPDADVDYTAGQVEVTHPKIDYSSVCGNISSAVGPFAILKGFVHPQEPVTAVRIHNTNSGKIILSHVPVSGGEVLVDGDFEIPGVPGSGAKILLDFADLQGSITGKLFPTGLVREVIKVEGFGDLEVSAVDIANPLVFARAKDIGLKGTEAPQEVDSNPSLLELLERIRGEAGEKMGILKNKRESAKENPALPILSLVSPPASYKVYLTGKEVPSDTMDLCARVIYMQGMHKTYPGTASICTSIAARVKGTVVHEVTSSQVGDENVRIGHPGGVISIESKVLDRGKESKVVNAKIGRTARILMEGRVFVKET